MAKISDLKTFPILDSRGEWTIEVEAILSDKRKVRASVPQGKSTGTHEADVVSAARAIKNIEKFILPEIKGADPLRQKTIDDLLIRLDGTRAKRRLGGNTILGVSMACARAAALVRGIPLWQHVRNLSGLKITQIRGGILYPRLYMNIINGGLHAGNNLDFQEYLIIPRTRTFREAALIGERIYHETGKNLQRTKGKNAANVGDEGGFAPNFKNNIEPFAVIKKAAASLGFTKKIDLGLDAAASGISIRHEKLISTYRHLARRFQFIYLEDPFGEEAFLEFSALRRMLGPKIAVVGDDLTTTNVQRMEKAHANQSVNGVIIKPNQIGTVSEALLAVRLARKYGWAVVVSHRSGETNDDFIADFAYGVGADGFKLGAPARGERVAKYNRLLEIEMSAINK